MIDWNLVGAKTALGLLTGTPGSWAGTAILISIFIPQQGSWIANLMVGGISGAVCTGVGEGVREFIRQNGIQ